MGWEIGQKQDLPRRFGETRLSLPFWENLYGGWFKLWFPPPIKQRNMPVRIRMKRVGAKNAPVFRIVVADGRSPRDGKFIEEIGTYQPRKKGDNFKLDLERAKYWVSKGAQPSDTVASFIKKATKAAATPVAA